MTSVRSDAAVWGGQRWRRHRDARHREVGKNDTAQSRDTTAGEPVLEIQSSRLPERQPDDTKPREFELHVPGVWYARRLDNSSSDWMKVASSPGKLRTQAGLAYLFDVSASATD